MSDSVPMSEFVYVSQVQFVSSPMDAEVAELMARFLEPIDWQEKFLNGQFTINEPDTPAIVDSKEPN